MTSGLPEAGREACLKRRPPAFGGARRSAGNIEKRGSSVRPPLAGATLFEAAWLLGCNLRAGRSLGFPRSGRARADLVLDRELENADFRSGGRNARRVGNVADDLPDPAYNRNRILCHVLHPAISDKKAPADLFGGLLVDTPDIVHHVGPAVS